MQKLANFLKKSAEIISEQTTSSFQNLIKDIENKSLDSQINLGPQVKNQSNNDQNVVDILPLTTDKISLDKPLQQIELQQSNVIQLQSKVFSLNQIKKNKSFINKNSNGKGSMSNSRIKQIQDEKKKILQKLKKLDGQIAQIKRQKDGSQSLQRSKFHKKVQISDDIQAKKQAQSLVKQLHLQKMKIEQKKRKMQQKQLQQRRRQQQVRKQQKQQIQKRLRQQKRNIIQKRMQQQRKKRQQRKLVDKQANVLISQLKKQQQLQKQSQLIPGQIQQYQQKKKLLQKKHIFNISQIQNHQLKYKQYKSKQKQLRRQKSQSHKISYPTQKYGKNIWVQRIQQQQVKRKQQEKIKQLNKKIQLQKRIKYGDIVKNIFMSKHKKRQQSIEETSKEHSQHKENSNYKDNSQHQQQITLRKPQTPDVNTHLPQIPRNDRKRQNQTDKKFKQRQPSNSILQDKKSKFIPKPPQQIRQKDPEQVQKLQKQKIRQMQLRKQTKQRLKKLQNQSIDLPKPQKIKYQNYMSKVKVKRSQPHDEWKRIMSNQKLSKQQKYKQMLSRANHMQNQAKIKQDLRKSGDQDAVNLYIGSIQAKLALLEKF